MKIALVGATGRVGARILAEAVARGHEVTAISRSPETLKATRVRPVAADVNDGTALTAAFRGADAIIHAYAPPKADSVETRVAKQRAATRAIIAAAKSAGVRRILAVGGAGTLEVAPGVRNMDRPEFPKEWEGGAKSTAVVKELLSAELELAWTSLSPPHFLQPGERTGRFRVGGDEMLVGANGESRISMEDFAIAMIDELENPKHTGQRFTVGY